MGKCIDQVYKKILYEIKQYKHDEFLCERSLQREESSSIEDSSFHLQANNLFKYNNNLNNFHDEKLGAKIILELFEIFRSSQMDIIQELIHENVKLKNDLRLAQGYINNLDKRMKDLNNLLFKFNEETVLTEGECEGKLQRNVAQHPSQENCVRTIEKFENFEEKVYIHILIF